MNRVLVVAASPINRIVISRIIERIYLKSDVVSPESALGALLHPFMMVIIDEAMDPALLDPLLGEIARRRRADERRLPRTLLIVDPSRQNRTKAEPIDAIVVKPITPDILQPVVQRLAGAHGG